MRTIMILLQPLVVSYVFFQYNKVDRGCFEETKWSMSIKEVLEICGNLSADERESYGHISYYHDKIVFGIPMQEGFIFDNNDRFIVINLKPLSKTFIQKEYDNVLRHLLKKYGKPISDHEYKKLWETEDTLIVLRNENAIANFKWLKFVVIYQSKEFSDMFDKIGNLSRISYEVNRILNKKTLNVQADLKSRMLKYVKDIQQRSHSNSEICQIVVDAQIISKDLGKHLSRRRDKLFNTKIQYDLFEKDVQALKNRLVGVGLKVGATTFYAKPNYYELAQLFKWNQDYSRQLSAVYDFMGKNYPVWMEQTNDLGSCADLHRAVEPLTKLGFEWKKAPTCLKKALGDAIEQELLQMTGWPCFCKSKSSTTAAIEKIVPVLRKLDKLGGDKAATRIINTVKLQHVRFNGRCAH